MTSTNIVFPPPPPPPPPASASFDNYPSPSNHTYSSNSHNINGRGGQYNGRGYSNAQGWLPRDPRGGRSGGSSGYSNPRTHGQQSGPRGGYNIRSNNRGRNHSFGSVQYPQQHYQAQQLQHSGHSQRAHGISIGPYVPAHGGTTSMNPYLSNNTNVKAGFVGQSVTAPASINNWLGSERQNPDWESLYNTNSALMVPQTRLGFPEAGQSNSAQLYGQNSSQGIRKNFRPIETTFLARQGSAPQRSSNTVLSGSRYFIPKILAPPPVPEFSTATSIVHPPSLEKAFKPRKKRKHNQLGLTPKTEDHESSEDEDIDEESKLAAVQTGNSQVNPGQLQFLYKGRLATLNSPSEIAAWIEERKKRFPTRKRIEEEARRGDHSRQADRDTAELQKANSKHSNEKKDAKLENTAKAKQKAEKLRKQYEKAQRRVVEMEAKSLTSSPAALEPRQNPPKNQSLLTRADGIIADNSLNYRADARVDGKGTSESNIDKVLKASTSNHLSSFNVPLAGESIAVGGSVVASSPQTHFLGSKASPLLGPTILISEDPLPEDEVGSHDPNLEANVEGHPRNQDNPGNSFSSSSSEVSSSNEDDTSSSGSSSEGDTPAVVTSKLIDSIQVLHKKTNMNKTICKLFLMKGYCPRGDRCLHLHELPKRGSRKLSNSNMNEVEKTLKTREAKRERVTLYQRMLAQQQEREDEVLLQHIIFLGEHHALDALK